MNKSETQKHFSPLYSKPLVAFDVIKALYRVVKLRFLRREQQLSLPDSIVAKCQVNREHALRLAIWADRLVYGLMFWKPGRCVYRSYAVGSVLSLRGVPVTLNFGLSDKANNSQRLSQAHCWLTIDDEPFREKDDPRERYPQKIAGSDSTVHFWIDPRMRVP